MNYQEYVDLIELASSDECMVPECFVLKTDTADILSPDGIGNIVSHFGHYAEVLRYIGAHDNLLDIGCGCGFAARLYRLRTQGRVVAVDKYPSIEIARTLYAAPGVEYVELDLAEGALPEGPFDIAAMTDVYEHLPELVGKRLLREISRQLSERGLLVFSVPLGEAEGHNPMHLRRFANPEEVLDEIGGHLAIGQSAKFIQVGRLAGQVQGSVECGLGPDSLFHGGHDS